MKDKIVLTEEQIAKSKMNTALYLMRMHPSLKENLKKLEAKPKRWELDSKGVPKRVRERYVDLDENTFEDLKKVASNMEKSHVNPNS